MSVVETLMPLIVLVLLGTFLRRSGFMDDSFFRKCNALVFWVALPCLLLEQTSRGASELSSAMRIFQILLIATGACLMAAYLVAWIMRTPPRSVGVFVQGSFRGNLAYVGLAVIAFHFGSSGAMNSDKAMALAALSFSPLVPLYNLVAVVVLLGGNGRGGRSRVSVILHMLVKIVTNPLLIACVLGISMSVMDVEMPLVISRVLQAVGRISLPLALMGIGSTLSLDALRGDLVRSFLACLIKLALAPVIGIYIGRLMGLDSNEIRIAAILLGCPTAVVSYVMADQLDGDSQLAGSIVILATVLSAITLAIILAISL